MSRAVEVEAEIEAVRQWAAKEVEQLLTAAVTALAAPGASLQTAEAVVRAGLQRLGGAILGGAVRALGNGYEGSRPACACGHSRKYLNDRPRQVVSLVGRFSLTRAYYWCPHCHASDAPLDRRLGIVGTAFSPAVVEAVGLLGARVPFATGRDVLMQLTGTAVSKRMHEEIAERLGAARLPVRPLVLPAPKDVPRRARPRPEEDLYVCADGTMAPTLQGWREVKLGAVFHAARGKDGLPERGATRYLGDLTDAETFGGDLYRAACTWGLADARRVVVLADGAVWIWNAADLHFPGAIQIVDWFHPSERLWTVAKICLGEQTPAAAAWARAAEKLLHQSRVEAVVRKLRALRPRDRQAQDAVAAAIGYFEANAERMRYRRFRRLGLFIGSGVIEAGGKHIVGQRLKLSGMRWSDHGLRTILHLRLAVLNGDWPQQQKAAA